MNGIDRCVWLSIRPGISLQPDTSTTVAPGASIAPTAEIFSPSISTSASYSPSAAITRPPCRSSSPRSLMGSPSSEERRCAHLLSPGRAVHARRRIERVRLEQLKPRFWKAPGEETFAPLTRADVERAEAELGVRLPRAYVELLEVQNGGYV